MAIQFDFTKNFTKQKRIEFSNILRALSAAIGFKVSPRGWCYIMEQHGYITKNQFDKVDRAINACRKEGLLPVDFIAEDDRRSFKGIENPSEKSMEEILEWMLRDVLTGDKYYTPNWWEGEEYYIQIVVEKVDLVPLFEPICKRFHIPIANAAGWQSILQRAEYARRFRDAEDMGLQPVLLYCGDHDPDGLRISDQLRKNLDDVKEIVWGDGTPGYDPSTLEIKRFGLNYDFIIANNLTWIDNLITGNQTKLMDLSDPKHPNHRLPYVQDYINSVGVRKCEANAIVVTPQSARDLVLQEIVSWVGEDAEERFRAKRQAAREQYDRILTDSGLITPIVKFLDKEEDEEETEE
jgi:hypothetical protein